MNRKRVFWIVALLGLVAVLLLMLSGKDKEPKRETNPTAAAPTPSGAPITVPPTIATPSPIAAQSERRQQAVELVKSIYSAPIAFYGKAQDQNGNPVPGANVRYSALDKFWQPGTKYEGITDVNGFFSIAGIQGAALSVQVSKDGYDRIYNQSDGSFSFGVPHDPQRDRQTPTKDAPTIFVLRKRAEAEPMLRISSRQFDVSRQGAPTEVNLSTGKVGPAGQGHLKVECWAENQGKELYDWKCRVSVPGGGIVPRNAELDFEAPEDGYAAADEITMTANNPQQRWSREAERQYFLKLADGRYARAKLTIYTGDRTFFVLESYLNPSGSRNLEYDPTRRAQR